MPPDTIECATSTALLLSIAPPPVCINLDMLLASIHAVAAQPAIIVTCSNEKNTMTMVTTTMLAAANGNSANHAPQKPSSM